MTKITKASRAQVKRFVLTEAQARASAKVRAYLSQNEMGLAGVDDFEAAMGAIVKAMMEMYVAGMSDVIAAIEGE
jgi:hypothetical protein